MSALGTPVLINPSRAYWLSSIGNDVIHSTIKVDEIDANRAYISSLFGENITASTINVSTLNFENSDVSGMYVSSIQGNSAFFSSLTIASDLSGGLGYVRFHVDASGVQVDGDPIRFDNLVYLTSTINIVQVSTLIDTDIFAQNGYFSTVSSGSLSTGLFQFQDLSGTSGKISTLRVEDLSANYGAFRTLSVSTLEAIDISGVASGKNWSLYPTLNSSITFQPSYVLSNVGNTLWFAGNELTDASGGGQDWSVFPAFSTVQMTNNSFTGVSTVYFQDGGRLTSLTGNNLQYNGQPIQYGATSNVSQWASYPASANVNMNGNTLSNVSQINGSNLALSGSNITNGNTFTNSLGVGGTSLISLATINSLGQGVLQDLDVGSSGTSIGDLNVYGVNALPGDNALYVLGGTTLTGGLTAGVPVHGTEIGALPVAGIDTVRIDVLPAGMGLNSATYIQLAAAGAGSFAAGGALSLAGGDYVEINTDDLRVINTTSGNQSTTLTVANIQMPGSVAATVPLQINNTAGGGINLIGTAGVGQIAGFSSIYGDNITSPMISSLSTNANAGRFNIIFASTIWNNFSLTTSSVIGALAVNNIKIADDITGVTNAPMPLESRIVNFSSINSFAMSTTDLWVSSINGATPGGGGGGGSITNFSTLNASSFQVSTMKGYGMDTAVGSTIFIEGGLEFVGQPTALPPGIGGRFLSSLRHVNSTRENVDFSVSSLSLIYNEGINPDGYVRIGGGGAFDSYFVNLGLSTLSMQSRSSITAELTVSSIKVPSGLGFVEFVDPIRFATISALDNCDVINTNPLSIPLLQIGASTILLAAANTFTQSISSFEGKISSFASAEASISTLSSGQGFISSVYSDSAKFQEFSSIIGSVSTFSFVDQSSTIGPPVQSSFLNISMGYDLSGPLQFAGLSIENYINQVDNFDFFILGNGDGATITSYQNNRSNAAPLVITSQGLTLQVDNGSYVAILEPGSNIATYIDNNSVSTGTLIVDDINGYGALPAYGSFLTLSTMNLYAASTTLLAFSTATQSNNIDMAAYDLKALVAGVYKIGVSLQMNNNSGTDSVEVFFQKNNITIDYSASIHTIPNNEQTIMYVEIIEPMAVNDAIEIGMYTNSSDLICSTTQGTVAISPGAIATMYRVDTV